MAVARRTTVARDSAPPALRRLAWLLDDAFRVPGTDRRFGIDPLLGLLPVGGDVAGAALSGWIVITAARLGAPPSVLVRMGGNLLLDAIVGAVPVLGDLFDAGWKANRRNVDMMRAYIEQPAPVHRHSRALVAGILILLVAAVIGAAVVAWHVLRWFVALF